MEKIRIDVVGLAHMDVRDCWREYTKDAIGKSLTLQPEPENIKDPFAVRVREGSRNIGHVAVTDLDVVYQALYGSKLQRLRGVVVKSNAEPPVLTVECEVETIAWDYEPFDSEVYGDWKYDGLPLMPRKLEMMQDLTADLIDFLEAGESAKTILKLGEQFLEMNPYDLSREMTRARYRIERLLAAREEPELKILAEKLSQEKGMIMRHENREKVARYLFIDLPKRLHKQGLEDSHYTYNNRLKELESQLQAFPYHLYDKFLYDPVDFLREVYYNHVPRKYLFPLLSGIVLMILKGMVEIQRWGRDGDRLPISEIKKFRKIDLSNDEKTEIAKASIKELLEKKDGEGKPVISQKNQWAAIMSIIVKEYALLKDYDMKAFCKKMDEWGFGEDSSYSFPCNYDSLSKCTDYAKNLSRNWDTSGTQYKRMVNVANVLREIVKEKLYRK